MTTQVFTRIWHLFMAVRELPDMRERQWDNRGQVGRRMLMLADEEKKSFFLYLFVLLFIYIFHSLKNICSLCLLFLLLTVWLFFKMITKAMLIFLLMMMISMMTRRYRLVSGLTSRSCRGLRPSAKAFFALWAKKNYFCCWCFCLF